MLVGHFDVSAKYLIASYIEDNAKDASASSKLESYIQSDLLLNSTAMATATSDDIKDVVGSKKKPNDLVGDFIECAKKGGTVFSGHIH